MNHTVSDIAPCRKRIECAFEPGEVDQVFDDLYRELGGDVAIKGFRKGRAPRVLLERRFGKGMAQDAGAKLVSQGLEKAMEEAKINPLAEPSIAPDKPVADPGKPFAFSAELDVRPDFELAEYRGLALEEPSIEPEPADIESRLQNIRENLADRAETDQPAAADWLLRVDVVVTAGGREILKREGQWVKNAGGQLFGLPCPELPERLTGARKGDTVELEVTVPDDHPEEDVRGSRAQATLAVQAVESAVLPDLDDTLAVRCGLDSLEALRERVTDLARGELAEARHAALEKQIVDQLLARMPFELPAATLDRQSARLLLQQRLRLARMGASRELLTQRDDDLRTATRGEAERQLRWTILADAIADQEKFEVTPEDVQEHIALVAQRSGATPAQVVKALGGQSGLLAAAQEIRAGRVVALIIAARAGQEGAAAETRGTKPQLTVDG